MPELPEVEVTRLSLVERLRGARIGAVRLGKPLRWPLGCAASALVGRRVDDVTRRGKYLWFGLGPGEGTDAGGLLVHLGMSGSLNLAEAPGEPGPWDHFDMATDRGLLRLTDPRRFGAVVWSSAPHEGAAGRLLAGLGVEPFDAAFDGALLRARLRGRRVSIKQALLAGDIVVGVGNIYASKAPSMPCALRKSRSVEPPSATARVSTLRIAAARRSQRSGPSRAPGVRGSMPARNSASEA